MLVDAFVEFTHHERVRNTRINYEPHGCSDLIIEQLMVGGVEKVIDELG